MACVQMAWSHLGTVSPTVSLGAGGRQQRPGCRSGSSHAGKARQCGSLHEQDRRVTAESWRTAVRRVFSSHAFRRLGLTQRAGFMQKIILMSVIYATAIIPILAARDA